MRYAQPLMFTDMPDEVLESMAVDAEHLELLQRLDVNSGIVVPLIARGRVLGTVSLIGPTSAFKFGQFKRVKH